MKGMMAGLDLEGSELAVISLRAGEKVAITQEVANEAPQDKGFKVQA